MRSMGVGRGGSGGGGGGGQGARVISRGAFTLGKNWR